MAGYGYGYANFTSQPQQYTAGSFASSAGTYGYASTNARVVQPANYQATTYGTGFTSGATQAATTGGYGYFQRAASDQTPASFAAQKTSYATTQAYVYGSAKPAAQYSSNTPTYKQNFSSASSTTYSGYTNSRSTSNNTPIYKSKPASSVTSNKASHQNAYEKVVYNAATSFLTQQAQTTKPSWQKNEKPVFKLPHTKSSWPRNSGPAKPQQLHYCEVCKISCAGQLTYKEHLEGQKHKKKANSAATNVSKMPPGTYKCELCEVICTGKDAFAAHVKGSSHQKTLKLHQKLGKPIPEVKVPEVALKKVNVVKTAPSKINFVGGTKLTSTGNEERIERPELTPSVNEGESSNEVAPEAEPVGESYVEDITSDLGKVISFKCTLCDCRFNDVIAKNAHVKGRRHRLNYKKKVDPSIHVDMKGNVRGPNGRWGKMKERANQAGQEMEWKQRQQEQMRWEQELRLRENELRRWEHDEYMRRASEDRYWTRPDRNRMQELEFYEWEHQDQHTDPRAQQGMRQSPEDQLIMARHNNIYPNESELKQVQNIVAAAEKTLKKISDAVAEEDLKNAGGPKVEAKKEESGPKPLLKPDGAKDAAPRQLKGVMRIGALAKGLLLQKQLNVEIVVLCLEKPTATLLKRVGKMIPEKLTETCPDDKYNMSISVSDCSINITSITEPKASVKVILTSPAVRSLEEEEADKKEAEAKDSKDAPKKTAPEDPKDVLDKEKCLRALAELRHAKWFQARANQLASCVVVIRLMRDLCLRVPAFKPLNQWSIELLCEKAIGSYFQPMTPGQAFRRVIECLASGLLLPGGAGLIDPCEKEKVDAAATMTTQEREDITAAAQHALRLIAFRQMHKVLGVEALKPKRAVKRPAPAPETAPSESKTPKKD